MPGRAMKILMLHGHDQSAQIFQPKARYVEAAFHSFARENDIEFRFQYLSGVLPARPDRNKDHDHWVWGYGDPSDGEIKRIELSVQHILATLDRDGPFVGIAGFSSGAAMAAIIASHIEKRSMFNDQPWLTQHPPLRFALCLSGFRLGPLYEKFYNPTIRTPIFLTIGSHDPVILPESSRSLAKHCQFAQIFEFPGVHYVPQSDEFPNFRKALADFLDILNHAPTPQVPALTTLKGGLGQNFLKTRPFLKTYCRRKQVTVTSTFYTVGHRQIRVRRGRKFDSLGVE